MGAAARLAGGLPRLLLATGARRWLGDEPEGSASSGLGPFAHKTVEWFVCHTLLTNQADVTQQKATCVSQGGNGMGAPKRHAKTGAERVAEHRRRKELALAECQLSLSSAAQLITDLLLQRPIRDMPLVLDTLLMRHIEREMRERFASAEPPVRNALETRLKALKIRLVESETFAVMSRGDT